MILPSSPVNSLFNFVSDGEGRCSGGFIGLNKVNCITSLAYYVGDFEFVESAKVAWLTATFGEDNCVVTDYIEAFINLFDGSYVSCELKKDERCLDTVFGTN